MNNISEIYSGHSYIRTYCGVKFPVFNPSIDDVKNEDIINVLPRIPRFGGHTFRIESVAEHTLLVRDLAVKNNASQDVVDACLIHDFSEIYLCDLPSPYKSVLSTYKDLENQIQNVIYKKYNCPRKNDEVRTFDIAALYIEAHDLMPNSTEDWGASLDEILPHDFKTVRLCPFRKPQLYFKWKLRKLIADLCNRRNVNY